MNGQALVTLAVGFLGFFGSFYAVWRGHQSDRRNAAIAEKAATRDDITEAARLRAEDLARLSDENRRLRVEHNELSDKLDRAMTAARAAARKAELLELRVAGADEEIRQLRDRLSEIEAENRALQGRVAPYQEGPHK